MNEWGLTSSCEKVGPQRFVNRKGLEIWLDPWLSVWSIVSVYSVELVSSLFNIFQNQTFSLLISAQSLEHKVQIPLEAEFGLQMYGTSSHRAFYYHPFVVLIW